MRRSCQGPVFLELGSVCLDGSSGDLLKESKTEWGHLEGCCCLLQVEQPELQQPHAGLLRCSFMLSSPSARLELCSACPQLWALHSHPAPPCHCPGSSLHRAAALQHSVLELLVWKVDFGRLMASLPWVCSHHGS